ncbi:hypothetical protein RhiirB3_447949 [Rhizophagus irregularis]|nr:hypothetical protein RhiirB3_447949 [Rhizophagus irregularis]
MSSPYDPADDAIDTVLSGLLPALIFGMFSGFESEKKKKISFINIFDDLIIFGSIVAFPLYSGFEWLQYDNEDLNKPGFLLFLIVFAIISYLFFLFRFQIINYPIMKYFCLPIYSTYFFIISLGLLLSLGYSNILNINRPPNSQDPNFISDYCIKNFGFSKCKILKIMNDIISCYSTIVLLFHFSSFIIIVIANRKKFKVPRKVLKVLKVLKWFHMISLTVYPAIISGYLLSNNPRTTKIAFGITSISFTRLVNHFGDKPEEINTAVSTYLNFNYNNESQIKSIEKLTENFESIEILTEEVEKLTSKIKKKMIEVKKWTDETKVQNEVTEEPKNEIEAEEEQRIEIKIKNLTKELTEKIPKLRREKINEIENLIKGLADTCKQNVEIKISDQPVPTEEILSNLRKEIIEIEILKDEITWQLENMKKLKEEIIKKTN